MVLFHELIVGLLDLLAAGRPADGEDAERIELGRSQRGKPAHIRIASLSVVSLADSVHKSEKLAKTAKSMEVSDDSRHRSIETALLFALLLPRFAIFFS